MIIDIGANIGGFAIEVAKRNPSIDVLAVEPINELINTIKSIKHRYDLDNLLLEEAAINLEEGTTELNVSSHHDRGITSLLKFNQSNINSDIYWSDRADLFFDSKQVVKVRKLSSILEYYKPECIEFIKIDAQGVDLNVLKSLDGYLKILEAGVIEVTAARHLSLYHEDVSDIFEVANYLHQNDFYIYAVKPNDHASNELNLFFCRNGISYKEKEEYLKLKGINLYDGNFWHIPSDHLQEVEKMISDMRQQNEQIIPMQREVDRLTNELISLKKNLVEQEKQFERVSYELSESLCYKLKKIFKRGKN